MAPSNLQGLNIVHPIQPANSYLSDADLLAVPQFPDLNAQLDLWTNLNFQSDEPLVSSRPGGESIKKDSFDAHKDDSSEDDPEEDLQRSGIAEAHSHENVVMGTVLPPSGVPHSAHAHASGSAQVAPPFDISTLLASFGVDPFMVPPAPMPQAPNPANTIAQLLSLHASSFGPPAVTPQSIPSSAKSPSAQSPAQSSQGASPSASTNTNSSATSTSTTSATAKRARTARTSISSVTSDVAPVEADSPEEKSSATPMTPAEDKRRRNTAASARFRLKKKEREAALERKAKELEVRVSELEKECEALRRENGWLKGLVVGVTGGAVQQQQQQQIQPGAPSSVAEVAAGLKRAREDDA